MVTSAELATIPLLRPIPVWGLSLLSQDADSVVTPAGQVLAQQHDRVDHVHLVTDGQADVFLHFDGVDDIHLQTIDSTNPLIGWSAFRAPHRFTATIKAKTELRTVRIAKTTFDKLFGHDPSLQGPFLLEVARAVAERLREATALAQNERLRRSQEIPLVDVVPAAPDTATDAALDESDLADVLSPDQLKVMIDHATQSHFRSGETLFSTDGQANHLWLLVTGQVQANEVYGPGRLLGWSSLVPPHRYVATAVCQGDCTLLSWDREWLADQLATPLGSALQQVVLHILGDRLRHARMEVIVHGYEDEIAAIGALIDQNAEELPLDSPIYKLPYFLQNRLTFSDALTALASLRQSGSPVEQDIATTAAEILGGVQAELQLQAGLRQVYELVARAPQDVSPAALRRDCASAFTDVFALTDYIIAGQENLPATTGHIFIMNHIINDEVNTLPNGFRLTMDTHFVASMILYARYQQAPIRVIRTSSPNEFAHQDYYDRLGYICVYRNHIDPIDAAPGQTVTERRNAFQQQALDVLASAQNLAICPEGNTAYTEDSPLPFKTGAFRVALHAPRSVQIVPIAVANFDKKISRSRLGAVVYPPFSIHDELSADVTDAELFDWTARYTEKFRTLVQQTRQLADS